MKKIISIVLCLALILAMGVVVSAAEAELVKVDAPKAGVAYKLGLYQGTLEKQLYFTGELDAEQNRFLAMTEDPSEAVDVYLEATTGGYYLYFMDGDTKTYIQSYAYIKEGNSYYSASIELVEEPENVYTYDSDLETLTYHYNDEEFAFLGTYGKYDTISSSTSYYVTGDNAANVEVTQFLAHFYAAESEEEPTETTKATEGSKETEGTKATEGVKETEAETTKATTVKTVITKVSTPSTGVAYKLGMNQENLGSTLYFTGETTDKDYYLDTTNSYADGVDVYLEAVEGGYRIYFMDGETKTYIDMYTYKKDNGYDGGSLKLTTEPEAVYKWDSEYKTLIATINGNDYYFGSYAEYPTMGASDVYYIADSFPVHLYTKTTSTNAETGDSISVIVALMAVSAIGIAVIGKKKEF